MCPSRRREWQRLPVLVSAAVTVSVERHLSDVTSSMDASPFSVLS